MFWRTTRYGLLFCKLLVIYSQSLQACKTCSDYKHVCLGYSESTGHIRSQSDSTPRFNDRAQHGSRVETCSPDPDLATKSIPQAEYIEPVQKTSDIKELHSSNNESAHMNKDVKPHAVDESSKSSTSRLFVIFDFAVSFLSYLTGPISATSNNRTHVPYFRYFGRTAIVPGFKQMVGESP